MELLAGSALASLPFAESDFVVDDEKNIQQSFTSLDDAC
jgi:hypothetical protein